MPLPFYTHFREILYPEDRKCLSLLSEHGVCVFWRGEVEELAIEF